jgi:FixJ family two-component response regulator
MIQVVEGRLNKQIAGEMGITETTVKVHRSNMMRKVKAASVAELCRMVDRLKLPQNSGRS